MASNENGQRREGYPVKYERRLRNKIMGQALSGLFLALVMEGCVSGPDFVRPAPPAVTGYLSESKQTESLSLSTSGEGSQRIIVGQGVDSFWWQELGSETLNTLIEDALTDNPTLSAAEATLRQAQEIYAAKSGSTRYPQVEGSLGAQRQLIDPGTLGQAGSSTEFSLYNVGVGIRYTFDLSGGNRRALEALAARSDYEQHVLNGARLALVANIATAAITQARLSRQIELVTGILQSQNEQLGLTKARVRFGQAAPDEVSTVLTQLEQTRASLPVLRNERQKNDHLLAVLVGRAPGAGELPDFSLEDFGLPKELPLLVPSALVRSRPDILAAEALLQAANAEYGVAISKLYPQLNLSADLASQALTTGALFAGGSGVWALVGQLTQPLLDPGLPAEKRAALAAFDEAAAHYQVVVLEALRNVADVLRTQESDAQRLIALVAAETASQTALESARHRYALGATSYYDVLDELQRSQQIAFDVVDAEAKRMIDNIAFFQAMGTGKTGGEKSLTPPTGKG